MGRSIAVTVGLSRGEGHPVKIREVHQIVAALSPGDAVGNEALAFQRLLRARGYPSEIYAGAIAPDMAGQGLPVSGYSPGTSSRGAVSIFHFAIGSPVAQRMLAGSEPLILRYHNVTPYRFFLGFSGHLVGLCYHGARDLRAFVPRASLGLAVSEFNRRDLENAGFGRTEVLPLAMNMAALDEPKDPIVTSRFRDGRKNLLFVGRVAPNKKIDDLIRVFCAYQRYVEPESRLFIVGEGRGFEHYTRRLDELVSHLRVDEVVFTGAVTQSELNAYYQLADAYLGLSEHEGYGAPLIEAMRFGIPVIAFDAGAVRETLQGGGVLLTEKRPEVVAELLGMVVSDTATRAAVLNTQEKALARIGSVNIGAKLDQALLRVEAAV
ncbi:MAG: glycosyltransferase [Vicinamibacteria bacterium]|nr:glycosyltransferase [Vicinamibacteria bacterium]